jgi:hypothetical protein
MCYGKTSFGKKIDKEEEKQLWKKLNELEKNIS